MLPDIVYYSNSGLSWNKQIFDMTQQCYLSNADRFLYCQNVLSTALMYFQIIDQAPLLHAAMRDADGYQYQQNQLAEAIAPHLKFEAEIAAHTLNKTVDGSNLLFFVIDFLMACANPAPFF